MNKTKYFKDYINEANKSSSTEDKEASGFVPVTMFYAIGAMLDDLAREIEQLKKN